MNIDDLKENLINMSTYHNITLFDAIVLYASEHENMDVLTIVEMLDQNTILHIKDEAVKSGKIRGQKAKEDIFSLFV